MVRTKPGITVEDAIAVLNAIGRGPHDPPLVVAATCVKCALVVGMLPQDASRADVHGHPKLCRGCAKERRRESRRVKP